MENDVKDGKAQPTETKSVSKAGWLKKSSGRFLGSYKDRYISVERTEMVVYDNEELEKCIERVDLEKYDKCCAARGAFQKKNRLVLVPAPKSKVHEIKLQVTDPVEKDAWLAAISDAINRAKNKIFDEVKVDESCSLEHVTRTRPKGNRSRRPPTRIHMKEVVNTSSDGILRLDLDAMDGMPNGTCEATAEKEAPREVIKPPMPPSKPSEAAPQGSSEENSPQKSAIKPPMPPSSDGKPKEAPPQGSGEEDNPQKSAIKPPMPPSSDGKPKEAPPQGSGEEDNPQKSAIKPPMPPSSDSKPKEAPPQGSGEEDNPQKSAIKPPMPPSSDSKPKEAPPQGSGEEDSPQKLAIKPPMSPSSESKPTASPIKDPTNDDHSSETECVPSSSPANVTSTSSEKAKSDETLSVVAPSPPSKDLWPPMPPSKDKKPILKPEDEVLEQPLSVEGTEGERPMSEDHPSTCPGETASGEDTAYSAEVTVIPSKEVSFAVDKEDVVPPAVKPEPTNLTAISLEKQELVTSSGVIKGDDDLKVAVISDPEPCTSNTEPLEQIPERVKKGPAPPAPPKKKPLKSRYVIPGQCNIKAGPTSVPPMETGNQTAIAPVETISTMESNLEAISCPTDTNSVILPTISSMEAENVSVEVKSMVPGGEIFPSTVIITESKEDPHKVDEQVFLEPKKDGLVIVLSSYDTGGNLNLSSEKIDRDEIRSSDSGQHSDDEMECGDNIRASTIALSGSRTRLDEEICEDSTDSMDNHGPPSLTENDENLHDIMKGTLVPELSKTCSPVFIPFVTRKCPSVGDLQSTSQHMSQSSMRNDIYEVQGNAFPDLKTTGDPIDKVSEEKGLRGTRRGGGTALKPAEQDLLTEALRRHQKGEQILREARIVKVHITRRQSW